MVEIVPGVSRTFNEFLLLPNRTTAESTPGNVDLGTPLVRHPVGGRSPIRLTAPFTSAIMQAVGSPRLAVALARSGGRAG